jgi:hypothetical protein
VQHLDEGRQWPPIAITLAHKDVEALAQQRDEIEFGDRGDGARSDATIDMASSNRLCDVGSTARIETIPLAPCSSSSSVALRCSVLSLSTIGFGVPAGAISPI